VSLLTSFSTLPPTDRRRLSDLNLPKENFLHLSTPESLNQGDEGEQMEEGQEEKDFRLIVTDESTNVNYTLNFRRNEVI